MAPEFLKAQIEVGTKVCAKLSEARDDLSGLRRDLSGVVEGYGAAIIAASTHPFANWMEQDRPSSPDISASPPTTKSSLARWSSAGCTCMWGSRTSTFVST